MNEPKIFISYAQDDADWVHRFAGALREHHVYVWPDAEPAATDDAFLEAVEAGLRGSDAIVFVLTQAGAQNPNVLVELGAAMSTGKYLIPIVPADLDRSRVPINFKKRPYLIKGTPDVAAREVAEAVKGRAA
jgi:nucleoside 2-deoxyribosyltransferase